MDQREHETQARSLFDALNWAVLHIESRLRHRKDLFTDDEIESNLRAPLEAARSTFGPTQRPTLTDAQLAEIRNRTHDWGPERIVINSDGEALSPERALTHHGQRWEIVFIRREGWTLGASLAFERVAHRTWPESWIGWFRRDDVRVHPMSEYNGPDEN